MSNGINVHLAAMQCAAKSIRQRPAQNLMLGGCGRMRFYGRRLDTYTLADLVPAPKNFLGRSAALPI